MSEFTDFLKAQIDMRKADMERDLAYEAEFKNGVGRHEWYVNNGGRNALQWALEEWEKAHGV